MDDDAGGTPERMLDVLGADGPAPGHAAGHPRGRADGLMLYGRFVGAWEGTVVVHRRDGTRREESCEVFFGWVLEGKAVQDVWIAPARKDRGDPGRDAGKDIYGTTIRVYDPARDEWEIFWIEPNTQSFGRMTGKRVGDEIVQDYRDEDGALWQWRFTEIADDSFHWIAQESEDEGATWTVRNEFFLSRRAGGDEFIRRAARHTLGHSDW